jgi:hypothetical protein
MFLIILKKSLIKILVDNISHYPQNSNFGELVNFHLNSGRNRQWCVKKYSSSSHVYYTFCNKLIIKIIN